MCVDQPQKKTVRKVCYALAVRCDFGFVCARVVSSSLLGLVFFLQNKTRSLYDLHILVDAILEFDMLTAKA